MKINTKKSETRNFQINTEYYTNSELEYMMIARKVFIFDEEMNPDYDWTHYGDLTKQDVRVFINGYFNTLTKIEVIIDEYGNYATVVVDENGNKLYVRI